MEKMNCNSCKQIIYYRRRDGICDKCRNLLRDDSMDGVLIRNIQTTALDLIRTYPDQKKEKEIDNLCDYLRGYLKRVFL